MRDKSHLDQARKMFWLQLKQAEKKKGGIKEVRSSNFMTVLWFTWTTFGPGQKPWWQCFPVGNGSQIQMTYPQAYQVGSDIYHCPEDGNRLYRSERESTWFAYPTPFIIENNKAHTRIQGGTLMNREESNDSVLKLLPTLVTSLQAPGSFESRRGWGFC